jgi:hypothetical protein
VRVIIPASVPGAGAGAGIGAGIGAAAESHITCPRAQLALKLIITHSATVFTPLKNLVVVVVVVAFVVFIFSFFVVVFVVVSLNARVAQ